MQWTLLCVTNLLHIDKAPQQGTPIEQELEADDVAFDLLLKGCRWEKRYNYLLGDYHGTRYSFNP